MTPALICIGLPALALAALVANWPRLCRWFWRREKDTDLSAMGRHTDFER